MVLATLLVPAGSPVSASGTEHDESFAVKFLLFTATILFVTTALEPVAARLRLPKILTRLFCGLAISALALLGHAPFADVTSNQVATVFGIVGINLVVFSAGRHTTIEDLAKLGMTSFLIAVVGICGPFILGFAVSWLFRPSDPVVFHCFAGAALTPTSMGIVSAVFSEAQAMKSKTATVTLGAAAIDDVLVMFVLLLIRVGLSATSDAGHGGFELTSVLLPLGFIVAAFIFGDRCCHAIFRAFAFMARVVGKDRQTSFALAGALTILFASAGLAALCGLEMIIGAFIAGLLLTPKHYRRKHYFESQMTGVEEDLEKNLVSLLILGSTFYFVLVSASVDFSVFGDFRTILLGLSMTAAAAFGKLACVPFARKPEIDAVAVGIAMMVRGEVVLVFADVGRKLNYHERPLIDDQMYGALIMTVVLCAILGPLALNRRLQPQR